MVAYACNLSIQEKQEDGWRFKAALGYVVRPCIKYVRVCVCVSVNIYRHTTVYNRPGHHDGTSASTGHEFRASSGLGRRSTWEPHLNNLF